MVQEPSWGRSKPTGARPHPMQALKRRLSDVPGIVRPVASIDRPALRDALEPAVENNFTQSNSLSRGGRHRTPGVAFAGHPLVLFVRKLL